jgi:hypothetical protein
LHKAIICFDIERFSDPIRDDRQRMAVRQVFYPALERAFVESGIRPDQRYHEDRGDGAFFLVPTEGQQAHLVEPLPFILAAELSRHNQGADAGTRIRLRVAMHLGFVRRDPEGVVSTPLNFAFRLLDSRGLRMALKETSGDLAFVASAEFYRRVLQERRDFDPSDYQKIRVLVKETDADAWICTFAAQIHAGQEYGERIARIETALASISGILEKARRARDVTVEKISSPVPAVPDLVTRLRERLAALDQARRKRRWSELITELVSIERAAATSLESALAVHRAVEQEPLERREVLRGLVMSYQAMTREHGRAELRRLDGLYRRAYDLLWRAPCDLLVAEEATIRYVRAVQEESHS